MSVSDVLIIASLVCFAALAVMMLRKTKKKGGCMGCSGCPMAGNCSKEGTKHE